MNQEKIGKFIASLRKEKNLTQLQLAEKLNITDRAVSKWECGKSMPDPSIMLELCKILGISVNELLIGEKIKEEEILITSDTNLVKALTIVQKNKIALKRCILAIIIIATILFLGYLIYWNYEIDLEYNNRLVECNIEDKTLIFKEYRKASGTYSIIINEKENITYVFFHSIDYLQNYIRFHKYFYDNIGSIAKSSHGAHCTITMDLSDLNVENNKLMVYYTNYHLPFNKELDIDKLPQLLKEATLLLEYN